MLLRRKKSAKTNITKARNKEATIEVKIKYASKTNAVKSNISYFLFR